MIPQAPPSSQKGPSEFKADGQYIAVCYGCGEPLKRYQVSFRVRDERAVDFDSKEVIDFLALFCPDCKERMLAYHKGGIRAGVERMKEKQRTLGMLDQKDRDALATVAGGNNL